jgi:hypothetical protein
VVKEQEATIYILERELRHGDIAFELQLLPDFCFLPFKSFIIEAPKDYLFLL